MNDIYHATQWNGIPCNLQHWHLILSIDKQDMSIFISPTGQSGSVLLAIVVIGVVAVLIAAVITVIAVLLRYTQPEKGSM